MLWKTVIFNKAGSWTSTMSNFTVCRNYRAAESCFIHKFSYFA